MNWLHTWISRSPRRALVLGKVLLLAGAILVLGAVFARGGLVALNEERTEVRLPALKTLAQAYPEYPTWVVPEGPVGFSIAALLILAGMAMTVLAERHDPEQRGGRR